MFNFILVRVTGVEPARVSPLDPKSSVYANFTTLADYGKDRSLNSDFLFRKTEIWATGGSNPGPTD